MQPDRTTSSAEEEEELQEDKEVVVERLGVGGELATRHVPHSNAGSHFELELDRRNVARGNAGGGRAEPIDGAHAG